MKLKSIAAAALIFVAAHGSIANPAIVPFVGDAQTRIRADRVYTHALEFGNEWNNPVVNGVQFRSTGQDGSDGAHSWGGFPSGAFQFQHNSPRISSPTDSGIYQVLGDFNHGMGAGTVWLDGLTLGIVYEMRFYHRPYEDPANTAKSRWQTFTFKPDANTADAILFNTDGQQEDQMLIYRYTATSGKLDIHCQTSAQNPSDTYHFYGLVNEQVYEVASTGVSDLTAVSARLNGDAIVGGEASFVTAFWQPADAGDWSSAESAELAAPTLADSGFYFDLAGLEPDTEYRFRFSLTNDVPRASWSEAETFRTLPDRPAFSVAPAQVSGTNATLGGTLSYFGPNAAMADVTLYWGVDPEALTQSVTLQDVKIGAFSTTLTGLNFGGTYYFRFMAENENNAQTWQDVVECFTTLAAPVWNMPAAASAHLALALSASFATPGAAVSDVTCWLGETPESMQPVATWLGSDATEFAHTETGLQPGASYSYAFHASCQPDGQPAWSVWSATNLAQVAHTHPLLPELSTGYYNVLMHLGASLADDSIKLNSRSGDDIAADKLTAFGGQAAQAPYPGLTYSGLPVIASAAPDLVWTVISNNAANGRWTMNRDDYIKYWHIYIISPDSTNRDARIYYTCDDRLHIWRNGEQILTAPYTGNESNANITLHPGVNSFAIKFIEEGGDDFFGFRITDRSGAPFDDLRYSFTASVMGPPTMPLMLPLALTHESVTIDPNFTNANPADLFDLYAVCDTQDRGAAFAGWTNSPTCLVQTFANITAPPATIAFELEPDTPYTIRIFTVKARFWERSLPLEFATYGAELADITSLFPTQNTGTSIVANASLNYCGPGLSEADIYLYWWSDADAGATTNSASLPTQTASPTIIAIPIPDLWYSQNYHYRFAASNELGFAWSPESVRFTTVGAPIFGDTSHAMPEPNKIQMTAEILSPGPEGGKVTCWLGADPDALTPAGSDTIAAPASVSFSQGNLIVGGTYYYAFQIESAAGSGAQLVSWDVWTATNRVVLTGATTWTAGGGDNDTRWQNAANWSHGVPGAGGTAVFPAGLGDITVTTDANIAINTVNILSGSAPVTFTLGAFALNTATFNVGRNGATGSMILPSGSTINASDAFNVGFNATAGAALLASGSRLTAASLNVGWRENNTDYTNDNTLTIEDGAEVIISGPTHVSRRDNGDSQPYNNHLFVHGLLLTTGVTLGGGGSWGGCSGFMTVDGGIVTNNATTTIAPWAGSNRTLALRNNARYIQTAGDLAIGTRSGDDRLHILDGSTFELAGNIYIQRGTDHSGNSSVIIVSNATLRVGGGIEVGRSGNGDGGNQNTILFYEDPGHETRVSFGGNFTLHNRSSNNDLGFHGGEIDLADKAFSTSTAGITNRLHFTRPTSRLAAGSFNSRADTRLTFDLPEDAIYTHPLIDITGAATFSAETKVEINIGKFIGSATLIESATGDFLPDYIVTVNQARGYKHKITAEPNLLKLTASVSGALIIVK